MIEEKLLSEFDISRELHTGIAVTRFLLNRFEHFLQADTSSGRPQYPYNSIGILIKIKQAMEKGQPMEQIEQTITSAISQQESFDATDTETVDKEKTPQSAWLQELLADLSEQQKRLAIAQEKRVQAEERKAAAIEKRANAEEQKAIAMGNIAAALQELTSLGSAAADPQISQIACQTAQIFPMEEDMDMATDVQDFLSVPLEDMIHSPGQEEKSEIDLDAEGAQDLSLLLDEAFPENAVASSVPDLADMPQDLDDDDDLTYLSDLDDLSDLIDTMAEEESSPLSPDSIDLDTDDMEKDFALDNLNDLIDADSMPKTQADTGSTLDDLSMLIDDASTKASATSAAPEKMNDLSALIQENPLPTSAKMDNLSLLVEPPGEPGKENASAPVSPKNPVPMDDLSQLVDTPSLKPAITPEEDLEAYKAAIIDLIMKQKANGVTPEQTAERMNKDEVRTLSGKPKWSVKAVKQIYKFIDAASSQ